MSYSSGTTSLFVGSAVLKRSPTGGSLNSVGPIVMQTVLQVYGRGVVRVFIFRRITAVGPARDSNSRGCRYRPFASRWGPGAGVAAAARPPRAALEPHPAVAWPHGRPGIVRAGGGGRFGAESLGCISVAVRRGRRRFAEVVGGVAWTWLCGPLSDAHECDKRGRGPEHGGRGSWDGAGRVGVASGPQRWIGCGVGEVRERGKAGRVTVGPAAGPRTAVKISRLRGWVHLSVIGSGRGVASRA